MRRVRDAIQDRPSVVGWLIVAYYVLAIVLRVSRTEGLQNDEAEQLFQSQFWLMGYGRQPPLYNWLQAGIIAGIGPSTFALSLLKNLLLCLTCLVFGRFAALMLRQKDLAYAVMLGLLALPAVTVLAQRDLTHAVVMMFVVAGFCWSFVRALKSPSWGSYALTGLAIGLGAISKYNFVILPVAALLAAILEPDFRRRIADRRLLVTVAIAAVVCLPHAVWALMHVGVATSGTINEMRDEATGNRWVDGLRGLTDLVASTVTASVPALLFFLFAFRRRLPAAWATSTPWTRLIGRMLLFSLLAVAIIGFAVGATTLTQKWISPFLLLLPVYLCLKIDAGGPFAPEAIPRLALPSMVLGFGFLLYLVAGNLIGPELGRYQKDSLPSVAFVRQVLDAREATSANAAPTYILASDTALAGSARIAAPRSDVVLPNFEPSQLAPLPQAGPGLVIWGAGNAPQMPEALRTYLRNHGKDLDRIVATTVDVPYPMSNGRRTARFAYAWIDAN